MSSTVCMSESAQRLSAEFAKRAPRKERIKGALGCLLSTLFSLPSLVHHSLASVLSFHHI